MRLQHAVAAAVAVVAESQETTNFGSFLLLTPLVSFPGAIGFFLSTPYFVLLLFHELGWDARGVLLSGEEQFPKLGAKFTGRLGREKTWRR